MGTPREKLGRVCAYEQWYDPDKATMAGGEHVTGSVPPFVVFQIPVNGEENIQNRCTEQIALLGGPCP